MTNNKPKNLSYLLRMWKVEEEFGPRLTPKLVWRVTLENVHTHTRIGFASLGLAFEFIQQQTISQKEEREEMN